MSDPGLRNYLEQIELSLKQRVGVVPEQVLYDLHAQCTILIEERGESPSNIDEDHLIDAFGTPGDIALSHGEDTQVPDSGNAPGWRICCTKCGRSSPAGRVGITRVAARSWHKYTAGNCKACGRVTPCRLIRDLDQVTITGTIMNGKTPEQLRRSSHHPWKTVAAILVLVAVINLGVLWLTIGN